MHRYRHNLPLSIAILSSLATSLLADHTSSGTTSTTTVVPVVTKERIITLGDSTTTGYLVDPYTTYLQADLPDFEVLNFGHSGATISRASDTPYDSLPVYYQAIQSAPDHVIMMFGLNDGKAHNWHSPEFIGQDYKQLIDTFADLPSQPSIWIVTPIPVIGSDSFGIDPHTVNGIIVPEIRKLEGYRGAEMIDLHLFFLDGSELYVDDAHPNAPGADRMAYIISDAFIHPEGSIPPPLPPAVPRLLQESEDIGGGWYRLDGIEDYYGANHPWLWHQKMGWIWAATGFPNDLWFYSGSGFGFFWTSDAHFPYIWREQTASWYYFDPAPGSNLIFNYRDYRWEFSPF